MFGFRVQDLARLCVGHKLRTKKRINPYKYLVDKVSGMHKASMQACPYRPHIEYDHLPVRSNHLQTV